MVPERKNRDLLTRIAARRGAKEKCDDSDKEERRGEQLGSWGVATWPLDYDWCVVLLICVLQINYYICMITRLYETHFLNPESVKQYALIGPAVSWQNLCVCQWAVAELSFSSHSFFFFFVFQIQRLHWKYCIFVFLLFFSSKKEEDIFVLIWSLLYWLLQIVHVLEKT